MSHVRRLPYRSFPILASLVSQAHTRFLIKIDQAFIRAVDLPLLLVLLH